MTKAAERDELVRDLAQLMAGLAVPVSMEMPLGRAGPAWSAVHARLIVAGWASAEDYEARLREALGILPAARDGVPR